MIRDVGWIIRYLRCYSRTTSIEHGAQFEDFSILAVFHRIIVNINFPHQPRKLNTSSLLNSPVLSLSLSQHPASSENPRPPARPPYHAPVKVQPPHSSNLTASSA